MDILIILFLVAVYGSLFYLQLASKKKAGSVLLDIGPLNKKWIILLAGYSCILIQMVSLYNQLASGFESWQNTDFLLFFTYGILTGMYILMSAYSTLQACENGILLYNHLIKWQRIESFSWEPENEKTWFLTLRFPGRMPAFMRENILFIPAQKKNELSIILENRLAKGEE